MINIKKPIELIRAISLTAKRLKIIKIDFFSSRAKTNAWHSGKDFY